MKRVIALLLISFVSGAVCAQADNVVSSNAIEEALGGDEETRALIAVGKRSAVGQSIDLEIEFEFDSSRLTKKASGQLDALLKALNGSVLQDYRFSIIGHTDGKGDEDYNLALSERRAASVVQYLAAGGVEKSRLDPEGKGETELLLPHMPLDASNRRVEIINQGEKK